MYDQNYQAHLQVRPPNQWTALLLLSLPEED